MHGEPDRRPVPPRARHDRAACAPLPVVVALPATVERDDIPRLCERLRATLAAGDARRVDCDAGALAEVDVVAVEALAWLALVARRGGACLRLRRAPAALLGLLDLLGLGSVVVQVERQAEQREQVGGVEEGGDPGDPVA
ncbi:MAG TPA: STAS domain-containing protein [Egibacteraceae bacterium]